MSSDPLPLAGSLAEPEAISDFLLFRLHRVLATAGALVTRMCEAEFGVTRREWRVLAMVAVHGPLGSTELAQRAQLDRPATSKAVSTLVAKSLIRRRTRSGDARFNELALTERGTGLYRRMFPAVREISRDMLSPLAADEVALLDSMLGRIQQHATQVAENRAGAAGIRQRGGRTARSRADSTRRSMRAGPMPS